MPDDFPPGGVTVTLRGSGQCPRPSFHEWHYWSTETVEASDGQVIEASQLYCPGRARTLSEVEAFLGE